MKTSMKVNVVSTLGTSNGKRGPFARDPNYMVYRDVRSLKKDIEYNPNWCIPLDPKPWKMKVLSPQTMGYNP